MKGEAKLFVLCFVALTATGLLCLYSASWPQALEFGMPPDGFFRKQALFALAAFLAWPAILHIPTRWLRRLAVPLLAVCLVLMALTLSARFGKSGLGARRWLRLGPLPAFQPSEFLKLATILFLARLLGEGDPGRKGLRQGAGLAVCLGFSALILLQRDYSTAVLYLGVCLVMLAHAGLKAGPTLLCLGALGVGGGAVLLSAPYRVRRLAAFLFPSLDPSGINYQVGAAAKAISSGGLLGKGLGLGRCKSGLPEVQNDFILASYAEETGFLGVAAVFALFLVFGVLGIRAARRLEEKEPFEALAVLGCAAMVVWQALINAAVVSGLFPPTGIPLPCFSQGGTNLMVVVFVAGLVLRGIIDSSAPKAAGDRLRRPEGDIVLPEGL